MFIVIIIVLDIMVTHPLSLNLEEMSLFICGGGEV
jgi:hypothetical protein